MTKIIAHITHKDNRKTPTGKEHLYSLTTKTMALYYFHLTIQIVFYVLILQMAKLSIFGLTKIRPQIYL